MYLQKINLKNKYALVTGAGKGLGRACSIALAEAGATVIALSRTSSDLDKLEKEIKKVKSKEYEDVSAVDGGTLYGDSRMLYYKYTPVSYPYTIKKNYVLETINTGFVPSDSSRSIISY